MRTPTHAAFGIIRKFSGIPHRSWGSRPASSVCFKAGSEAIRCAAEGRQTHRSDSAAPPPFRRWQITVGLPKNAMPPWERNTSHLYFFFWTGNSFFPSLFRKQSTWVWHTNAPFLLFASSGRGPSSVTLYFPLCSHPLNFIIKALMGENCMPLFCVCVFFPQP